MKLEKLQSEYHYHSAADAMSNHSRGDGHTFDGVVPDGWPVECIVGRYDTQAGDDFRHVCVGVECTGGVNGDQAVPVDVDRVKKAHDLCMDEVNAGRLDGFTLMVCKVRNLNHMVLDSWLWDVVGKATGIRPDKVTGEASRRLTYNAGGVTESDRFSQSLCQCTFGDVPKYKRPQ
jgi:hypothetical protein